MRYRLFTDATSDLPARYAEELNVTVLPMAFTMEDKEYFYVPGRSDMPIETFYAKMREGVNAITAQINSYTFVEAFEDALKRGEDVLYIGFSSKLSGTFQSAVSAASELRPQYPARTIHTIDSHCASLGEALLVREAAKRQAELSIDELAGWVEQNKLKIAHWFTVDDMVYLKRGGRVSGTTAAVATILNIKPVLHVDEEGYLVAAGKVQGRKKSLRELFDRLEATIDRDGINTVIVGHCDAQEDAQYVADLIAEAYPEKELLVESIGTSVGAHSGPGTVAVLFASDQR